MVPVHCVSRDWTGTAFEMKKKILVVDDDPVQRRLLEAMVSKMGFTAVCADSGREAVDLLSSKEGFDLVFLDLVMPEMDGIEVLEAMEMVGTMCQPLY